MTKKPAPCLTIIIIIMKIIDVREFLLSYETGRDVVQKFLVTKSAMAVT